MSRNHLWTYELNERLTEEEWIDYFDNCKSLSTTGAHPKWCQGGGGNCGTFDIWIYANKTKVQRIARRLDGHFGLPGRVRRSEAP